MNIEEKTLSNREIQILVIMMSHRNCLNSMVDFGGSISKGTIEQEMNKAGFSLFETNMAILSLLFKRQMINEKVEEDNNLNISHTIYSLTSEAEDWLLSNEENLLSH